MKNKTKKKIKGSFSLEQHVKAMPVIVVTIGENGIASVYADRPVMVIMVDQSNKEFDNPPQIIPVDGIGDVSSMDYGDNTDVIGPEINELLS